ncbi:thiamine phosphate synthase [Paenibacillus hamazuiensis]|uniref:thiamine phosphate synthase n=1 Tax=Paenibacillus hamazuiensis TaxID=2936508 RepID=UPI00200F0869
MLRQRIRQYLPLYLVMGLEGNGRLSAVEVAREALEGGVTLLQLREKNEPMHKVLEQGRQIRDLCRKYHVPFIVNDRIDVSLLLDADGVHVGQDDIPGSDARKLLGPGKIIGISAGNLEEAEYAIAQGADYLGVGAIYATMSKSDAGDPVGTGLLWHIRQRWNVPMVGIGGITHENAHHVISGGADGIAVVSAITKQMSPRSSASLLYQTVKEALSK